MADVRGFLKYAREKTPYRPVDERVQDYRRLLEQRRSEGEVDSKRGSGRRPLPVRIAVAAHRDFRTGGSVGS